ncbi:MAG: NADH:flavin oxidoreductase [Planctomycetia bacterium]|nr:NADH:flavin oxidoreductase [Planctomycetia bacterium]
MSTFKRLGALRSRDELVQYLAQWDFSLPIDEEILSGAQGSPLAQPWSVARFTLPNRWVIHSMEGWDANRDGSPSDLVLNRWKKFGASGAALIWGGEAFAVQQDGRANPRQLCHDDAHADSTYRALFETVCEAHREALLREGKSPDETFLVGLQLTHSGRFSKAPDDTFAPRIAYHHKMLDARVKIDPKDDSVVMSDGEIRALVDNYVKCARLAYKAGFHFVDVKHCHGYFVHELLSATSRPGNYGGDLQNRTRFLREVCDGIRTECPGMLIGVRLSIFDAIPGEASLSEPGVLRSCLTNEMIEIVRIMAEDIRIDLLNATAGSPYYSVYAQRPSFTPALEAVLTPEGELKIPPRIDPPEDPVLGCCRQIVSARELKRHFPNLPMVGTAYTYFQEFLPQVAQGVVREGWIDAVGIGRMVLPYGEMIADSLAGRPLQKRKICRTFSDCTTAPRNGMVSGCYPLDADYRIMSEALRLRDLKSPARPK